MVGRILRWCRGELLIRVKGAELERFLNRCTQAGVELRELRRTQLDEMTAVLSVSEFRRLAAFHKRTRCRVHIIRKKGVPFHWNRYRHRFGLWLGWLAVAATCFQLQTRVWVIRPDFADGIDEIAVMQELKEHGVHTGMKTKDVNARDIKITMLTECDDLSFFAANLDGCVLSIDTGAAEEMEKIPQQTMPCDVIAVKDGMIQRQLIRQGTEQFEKGDSVVKGQILVDALVKAQTDWGKDRLVAASGDIWALTKYRTTCVMPDQSMRKQKTGKRITRIALGIGKTRINFYRKRCPITEKCDKISLVHTVRLNDYLTLPIALYSETCEFYTSQKHKRNEKTMENRVLSGVRYRTRGQLTQGSLTSTEIEWDHGDGLLTGHATAWCYEQIGEQIADGRTQEDILPEEQENEESET